MNALQQDLSALLARHIAAAPASRLPRLLEALSDDSPVITLARPKLEGPRCILLDADGRPTTGEHVAFYDRLTDLTWVAAPLGDGKEYKHAAALKAASEVRLFGLTDWRAPNIVEALSLIDYTRHDPCVDQAVVRGRYCGFWTSTTEALPSGYARFVSLGSGGSGVNRQSLEFFARAVRAGQSLGLSAR